jgi:phosphomannomutase
MATAQYLGADAVVVPISCNDAVNRGELAAVLEPKTRIGSPHVIAGMAAAAAKGRKRVCGWEANGGFLLGSDLGALTKLATRDAMLPIVCVLYAAAKNGLSVAQLFADLPQRFSRSALLPNFPQQLGRAMVQRFSAANAAAELERLEGLGKIESLDYTDGVRMVFENGDVIHFRPSGNADELRIYAVAGTEARAEELAALGVAEPEGILRTLARP